MSKSNKTDNAVDYNRFFGLTTVTEVERLIYEVERIARLNMASKLEAFHEKYEKEQISLESSFSLKDVEKIEVNFWDDFYDDGYVPDGKVTETFAYIEDSSIPDIVCQELLSNLMIHIKENQLLPSFVEMRMHFSDSTAKYPGLIWESEYLLSKRWEIQIINISHKLLDGLIERLKEYSDGVRFSIYSES